MENIKHEKMRLGDLVVDWEINPREKNPKTIKEFEEFMEEHKSNALSFDEGWNQPIEATEDKIVIRGSHSLLAAKNVYGDQHEVAVRIHTGVTGKEKAAFLSAISNVHGKPYKQGERKKAVFEVFKQTQNLKGGGVKGKQPFLSVRQIAAMTGISKGYVWELRSDYRAENGLPNENGEILSVEELEAKRKAQRTKSPDNLPVATTTKTPPEQTDSSKVNVLELSESELNKMTQEELANYLQDINEPTPADPPKDIKSSQQKPKVEEEEDEDEVEAYASDEDYDIDKSDYLSRVEKDGYVEEDSKKVTQPSETKQKVIKPTVIGDTDIVEKTESEIQKEKKSERKEVLKNVEELMDDFLKIEHIEAKESIDLYRTEFEQTRDDEGLWEEPFDQELNGRDTIGSIILFILDRLEEEYDNYASSN